MELLKWSCLFLILSVITFTDCKEDDDDDDDMVVTAKKKTPEEKAKSGPEPLSDADRIAVIVGAVKKDTIKDVKDAAKLLQELENEAVGPQDMTELATVVLWKAWENYMGNETGFDAFLMLHWLRNIGDEERLFGVRLFELMDSNGDGNVTKDELVKRYSEPMASSSKAIELMFRLHDYDGNGFISVYEMLNHILTSDGLHYNVMDKYTEALEWINMMDVDNDLSVSLSEFMIYMVVQMNLGIAMREEADKYEVYAAPATTTIDYMSNFNFK